MANTKISDMTAAASLAGTELIPIVQGGANKSTTPDMIAGLVNVPSIVGLLDETAHDLLDHTGLTGIHASGSDDETLSSITTLLNSASADTTTLDADHLYFYDAVDAVMKKITWANLKALVGGTTTLDPIAFDFNDVDQGYTQTYILDIKASFGYTIDGVVLQSDSTMDNVEIQIVSTAVTWTGSVTSIDVTASVVETAAIATNTVSAGDQVKLVTSGTDGTPTLIRGKILRTAV